MGASEWGKLPQRSKGKRGRERKRRKRTRVNKENWIWLEQIWEQKRTKEIKDGRKGEGGQEKTENRTKQMKKRYM
jgi:hypothetical protein